MANDDFEERESALVVLLPAADDPVNAASSEDIAHNTFVWFGEPGTVLEQLDDWGQVKANLAAYAAETSPITVPVGERGELGDEGADVLFLEPTESLLALRDGLMAYEEVKLAHDSAEQYPEWTPHVTLGYPDAPATGEYDGTEITFDRFALWIGNERTEYPMGAKAAVTAAAPLPEAPEEEVDQALIDDPEEPLVDDQLQEEIPVHGVATIVGRPTGDGRMFDAAGVSIAPLPQPMGFEFESSHGGGNSRVSIVGRIDEMWIEGEEVRYNGVIMPWKPYANQAIEGIIDGSLAGVSVKIDDVAIDVSAEREEFIQRLKADRDGASDELAADEVGEEKTPMSDEEIEELVDAFIGDGEQPTTTFSRTRIRNFDIVAFQAFIDAWISLGTWADQLAAEEASLSEEDVAALTACGCLDGVELEAITASAAQLSFAPGTKDGPGWITHPRATSRIRRYWTQGEGAAKIGWGTPGDFNRCRAQLSKYVANPDWLAGLCANMHKEVLGIWPAQHHSVLQPLTASGRAPLSIVAAATPLPAEFFRRPDALDEHSGGVIVDGDHLYGYVAEWGVCHIGIQNVCTTAPHSSSDYGYFATGYVTTTEGEVRVGQITMDTGHAGDTASARAAAAHYDNTGACVADIAIGEDARGIWFSGMFRASATAEQRHALKASGRLSGDWRDWGMPELELVAALAVNVPGFPIPHTSLAASGGRQTSLVAAGIVGADTALTASGGVLSADEVAGIARAAVAEYVAIQDRRVKLAATAPLRQKLRAERVQAARARIEGRS